MPIEWKRKKKYAWLTQSIVTINGMEYGECVVERTKESKDD